MLDSQQALVDVPYGITVSVNSNHTTHFLILYNYNTFLPQDEEGHEVGSASFRAAQVITLSLRATEGSLAIANFKLKDCLVTSFLA
jgi:hypothetical protein